MSYGHIEICKILLDGGALPNMSGYENSRPLHEAAKFNRIEEAKLLLKYGADKNLCDQYGEKPMYVYMYMEQKILSWFEKALFLQHIISLIISLLHRDYCKSDEMRQLLMDVSESPFKQVSHLNQTLDKSFCTGNDKFVILASHLKPENKKLLAVTAVKHKFKVFSIYRYYFWGFVCFVVLLFI